MAGEERERHWKKLFGRLDGSLLEKLEDRDMSLEESFAIYAEGVKLLKAAAISWIK